MLYGEGFIWTAYILRIRTLHRFQDQTPLPRTTDGVLRVGGTARFSISWQGPGDHVHALADNESCSHRRHAANRSSKQQYARLAEGGVWTRVGMGCGIVGSGKGLKAEHS